MDSVPSGYKLQLYTSVCTAWLQRTWLNCVCPSLHQQAVVVGFGPPQPATWLLVVAVVVVVVVVYHAAN